MMISRGILTTIGATALGVGVVFGGATVIPNALAQDSTPAAQAPVQAQEEADHEARFAEAYDSFVATLASELDVDEAAVDAAIRAALKEQVAALEAAGKLDADEVAELQAMIDEAEVPFGFGMGMGMGGPGGFGGRGGMHGFGGEGHVKIRGEHRGPHGDFDGRGGHIETQPAPEDETAPASLPSSGEASDQSVPSEAASEDAVL